MGDLWGAQTTMWGWHEHPDFARLSAEFQDILRREFGQEEATRATAELLCHADRPQELDRWMAGATWIESEKRLRIGFGAWLWQSHHPSTQARDLFMKEFEWQTHHPMPRFPRSFYLASFALSSWLGKVPRMLGYAVKTIRPAPDDQSLEMVESIIRREWLPWPYSDRRDIYAQALVVLKSAGRMEFDLIHHALNVAPNLTISNEVCNNNALEPELSEVVYDFAAELTEENSHRFCYFSWPSGARWVIRACENVERLGLATLVSSKPDVYDRNHAIRKISAIKSFLPTDDLKAFKAELSRFSPTTRRLVAGCSDAARTYLLDDPGCALPPAYDAFKKSFLSHSRSSYIHFDNSPDPTDGVLPVAELRRMGEELGEVGRSQLLEEFAQIGGQGQNACLLLKACE